MGIEGVVAASSCEALVAAVRSNGHCLMGARPVYDSFGYRCSPYIAAATTATATEIDTTLPVGFQTFNNVVKPKVGHFYLAPYKT